MSAEHWVAIFVSTVIAATPLIYAALGELVVERAGVLNLGVEGMMLVGALTAFAVGHSSGSLLLGYGAAMLAGIDARAAVRLSHADACRRTRWRRAWR